MSKSSNERKWIIASVALLAASILIPAALMGFTGEAIIRSLPFPFIVVGMLITIRVLSLKMEARKLGTPVKDERDLMIEGKAGKITIIVNCYAMLALLWFNVAAESYGLNPLETHYVGALSVLITVASFIGLRWWFGREPRGVT
jgi:FtsH-binding integral membrane protein